MSGRPLRLVVFDLDGVLTQPSARPETAPASDGVLDLVSGLAAEPETVLAAATGASRRALDGALDRMAIRDRFVATATASEHPQKPHPAMLAAVLDACGLSADRTVMLGDSPLDMAMARALGVAALGALWGRSRAATLEAAGAQAVAVDPGAARCAIDALVPRDGEGEATR